MTDAPENEVLEITLRTGIVFPPRVSGSPIGRTKYPFDAVPAVGDGFEVNRALTTMRSAITKYNQRNRGKRKFAVRFIDGKSLVKRIL